MIMKLLAGTSGFSYAAWKGSFYPEKLPAAGMLAYYAKRLPAVEINNTFYRMPKIAALERWAEQVPGTFRFALKAPRRITHVKRLADCEAECAALLAATEGMHGRLASILFQMPPYLRCDLPLLEHFVSGLPDGLKAAFEFRHESWLDEAVFSLLARRDFAFVVSETDAGAPEAPWTASWAYLRLRKSSYSRAELVGWLGRLQTGALTEAQVFFKHEEEGVAPRLALELLELARAAEA